MRVNIINKAAYGTEGFNSEGGVLTGPMILAGNPTTALEASTKNYVDLVKNAISAGNITTGTLAAARLPGFNGDLSSNAGSNVLTLGATGVNAGTYTKVSVDSTGRVVGGDVLGSDDVPNMNWNKITSGKPTTIAGYGIEDAVNPAGDVINGNLTLVGHPVTAYQLATKGYVDSLTNTTVTPLNTGDTIRRPNVTTPVGFLRCNGGQVSKTEYSALYSVLMKDLTSTISVDYTSYSAMGGGQPWCQQYDFKISNISDITGWTVNPGALPVQTNNSGIVITKNKIYLFPQGSFYYMADISTDGSIGTWSTISGSPCSSYRGKVVVIKNKIYIFGGYNSAGTIIPKIYYYDINPDGTLSVNFTTTNIGVQVYDTTIMLTKNKLYLVGGTINGDGVEYTKNVYYYDITPDGNLSNSYTAAGVVPVFEPRIFITKNRAYLVNVNTTSTAVYTATIDQNGILSNWVGTPPSLNLPGTVTYPSIVTLKNRVFIIGETVSYASDIDINGEITGWTVVTSSPGVYRSSPAIIKNKIYLLGGQNTNMVNNIYSAPLVGNEALSDYSRFYDGSINKFDGSDISGNIVIAQGDNPLDIILQPGSGKPWKQQYVINTDQSDAAVTWTTGTDLPGALGYSQAVVTKNRVYLLGGHNGSYITTVYTAPINADGTLGTWTTGTSLPGALGQSQAAVTKNRVYLLGGYNSGGPVATVYTAPINADGTLGTWTTGTSLPEALSVSQAVVTKNRVYLLGGYNGNYVATVYTAPINADGTLGTWTTGTNLPGALGWSQAVVTKNRVYLLGGDNGSGWVATVYTAPINADGTLGTWTTGTSLPGVLVYSQAVVTKNRVYLLGGANGGSSVATVYTAPINADGTLGTWMTGTSLPGTLSASQTVVTKNRVYLLGGHNVSTWVATIYTAPILGGLNDYSPYYDGSILPTDPNNFQLPDTSTTDINGLYTFIKH